MTMDSPSSSLLTCPLFFSCCILSLFLVCPSSSTSIITATGAAAAAAPPFPKDALPTQSGYLRVNASSRSAIYFAYYEAQRPQQALTLTPLLVWLQGGPGCSSLVGNFFELGPWLVANSSAGPALSPNPYSWNRLFGLLFLDNPIGTGFSVAASFSEIPRDQAGVARHLWAALQGFFSSNPSFRSRPFYLTGESYAGKYVPAVGYHILRQNARVVPARRINLLGVAIGNGRTHPITQVSTHADSAYYSGLINERQKAHLEHLQREVVELTLEEHWAAATDARHRVLDWLRNATGLATLENLSKTKPYQTQLVRALLKDEGVKAALGVEKGAAWDSCSALVAKALHEDGMKSVKGDVEALLGSVRVLLYQGLYDLRDGVLSTEAWERELKWEGLKAFLRAQRTVWRLGGRTAAAGHGGDRQKGRLAGYVQRHGRLSQVVVAGAGHMAPADQGLSTQVMIEDWVLEKGLFPEEDPLSALSG